MHISHSQMIILNRVKGTTKGKVYTKIYSFI